MAASRVLRMMHRLRSLLVMVIVTVLSDPWSDRTYHAKQSTNQPTNQSTNQPINQLRNKETHQQFLVIILIAWYGMVCMSMGSSPGESCMAILHVRPSQLQTQHLRYHDDRTYQPASRNSASMHSRHARNVPRLESCGELTRDCDTHCVFTCPMLHLIIPYHDANAL